MSKQAKCYQCLSLNSVKIYLASFIRASLAWQLLIKAVKSDQIKM